jgi:hypothetical protein
MLVLVGEFSAEYCWKVQERYNRIDPEHQLLSLARTSSHTPNQISFHPGMWTRGHCPFKPILFTVWFESYALTTKNNTANLFVQKP